MRFCTLLAAVVVGGCSKTDTGAPVDAGAAAVAVSASPSVSASGSVAVPPSAATSVTAPAVGSAAPANVTVTNIGIHIGGGPNDSATKAPVKDSIAPHFEAFAKCYQSVEVRKSGDVGVDLMIEHEGGAANVSNPRVLGLRGDAFKACVVEEFGKVRFQKMRHGKTMASYSLRFVPKDTP